MVRSPLPAGPLTHKQTDGKFVGTMTIAGLGGLFRDPGEGEINPQSWFPDKV